ncbi:MAG: DUF4389 domain-containing protein [Actinocatenispora sp.]
MQPATGGALEQPVRLRARLDAEPSRWLWLVKWLLAIPHYVILYFLWIVFAVVTIIAFFAILITGRYPRGLFDLNVGIMRWTWRVAYYTYGVLGTDRYPPFSLEPRADYPADLTVQYPERLSRGLVLVKWWLLAIPHYLLLGVLLGTSYLFYRSSDSGWAGPASGLGLAGLLVLFVGISLLFTRHYPRGMFNLLVGIERWAYRVGAYVALMSDRYPPFRLDQGPDEPAPPAIPESTPAPPQR